MTVTPIELRRTLRFWASGVSVVTSATDQERAGMTVSAFNSLCLEPPLILVCLHKESRLGKLVPSAGVFAVSILDAEQVGLSERFSGRVPLLEGEDRFDGVPLTTAETGSPILDDSIAWLDCRVQAIHDGVTHWIVVGEVLATGTSGEHGSPLLYFNRGYRELERQVEKP